MGWIAIQFVQNLFILNASIKKFKIGFGLKFSYKHFFRLIRIEILLEISGQSLKFFVASG